jgi:hypothetical protein
VIYLRLCKVLQSDTMYDFCEFDFSIICVFIFLNSRLYSPSDDVGSTHLGGRKVQMQSLFGQAFLPLEPNFILEWPPLYEPFKLK